MEERSLETNRAAAFIVVIPLPVSTYNGRSLLVFTYKSKGGGTPK